MNYNLIFHSKIIVEIKINGNSENESLWRKEDFRCGDEKIVMDIIRI